MKTDSSPNHTLTSPLPPYNTDAGDTVPRGWAAWFGGPDTPIGPRIAPRVAPVVGDLSDDDSNLSTDAILEKQIAEEAGNAIQYRTCSWQKTAALLFSEYICLVSIIRPLWKVSISLMNRQAIMSFPWSYSILGLVPG